MSEPSIAGKIPLTLHLTAEVAARLPLTWIGILFGRIKADLVATSGVQLSYLLSIAAMTSLVANENKTAVITFTLTDS